MGYPVSVIIEEDGVITDCSLKTLEVDTLLDFRFDMDNVVNKVVLKTELLKDVIAELDPTSELVEVYIMCDLFIIILLIDIVTLGKDEILISS